jgi:hypothetical protein
MIARLIRTGASLFGYVCVATILAQIILLAYLVLTCRLDHSKVVQILAIAQGVDIFAIREQAQRDREQVSPEQVSYQQIRDTRAVKVRHLELREQALRQGLTELAAEGRKLAEGMQRNQQLRESFQKELVDLKQGAIATGRENARLKLEALKPKQAKEQLMEMLKKDELDEVVALLAAMPDAKAGKIMAEFKLPGEDEQLYQILRRIREGFPESKLATNAQNRLNQTSQAGP